MEIKPIETVYNGYRFRSRLEARWAVFFDKAGIKYEYEKEGYDLGKLGYYLPDFWLPDNNAWIEIKGRVPTRTEIVKLNRLTRLTKTYGHIFSGEIKNPSEYDLNEALNVASYSCSDGSYYDNYQCWGKCKVCGKMDIVFNGFGKYICSCSDSKYGAEHPDLLNAYKTARSARFEHGETPVICTEEDQDFFNSEEFNAEWDRVMDREERYEKRIEEKLKQYSWVNKPEGIPDEMFCIIMDEACSYEWWGGDVNEKIKDEWWSKIIEASRDNKAFYGENSFL